MWEYNWGTILAGCRLMSLTDIDKHFRALGLDSSASFAQVKEARGWYTKAFHPDRFSKGSKDIAKAEEKQKEINIAFEELKRWFEVGQSGKKAHHTKGASQAGKPGREKTKSWQAELSGYAESLRESGRSPTTIKNFYSDLRSFATWLAASQGAAWSLHGHDLEKVVVTYSWELSEQCYSPSTIARHLYSIKGFLAYAAIDAEFILSLVDEYKSEVRAQTKSLTEKQLASFLKVIETDALYDDEALIRFILQTGLSVSELCALKWKDIHFANVPGRRGKCAIMRVTGRSGIRQIPLNDSAVDALTVLGLNGVLRTKGKLLDARIFFRGAHGMTPKMVHYVIDRYAKIARIIVTPSILRNTFCKKLAESGVPLEHLAELIGVSETSAKTYYVAVPKIDDLVAAVDRA
jgi:integrase/recombinase XerC